MENKKNSQSLTKETDAKAEVLMGLHLSCTSSKKNSQTYALFEPEYRTSKLVNAILESKQGLTKDDITTIVNILNDIDKIEHYDGCGWLDYKMRLRHFLRLSGFDINLF